MYVTFFIVLIIIAFCFFGLSFIVRKISVPFIAMILFFIIGFFGMGIQDAQCELGTNSTTCTEYTYEDVDLGYNITNQNCTLNNEFTCMTVLGVDNYLPWIFSIFGIFSLVIAVLRILDFNRPENKDEV